MNRGKYGLLCGVAALALSTMAGTGSATADDSAIKIKWKGAPEIESADGKWKVKMRGRLFADYAHVSGDKTPGSTHQYVRATEFRAARLGIEGLMFGNTKYKFEVDFEGNEATIKDAYIQLKKPFGSPVDFKVGQFKSPNSLEEQTSSRFITFMERAAFTDAFGFARLTGIGVTTHGTNWTFNAGAFGENINTKKAQEGHTLAARVTFAPIATKDKAIHFGASIRYRKFSNSDKTVQYRQRPQVHQETRYISTPKLSADGDLLYGLEAAGVWGPFSVQGEYARTKTDLLVGKDPSFHGYYISASWFLTGEHRTYKGSKGAFGRVKVRHPVQEGGYGAWQVAVRYDTIDLNDSGVIGGMQDAIVTGVNWYLNDHTRVMFNYINARVDDVPTTILGESTIVAGTPGNNNNINAVQLRAQLDF